MPTLLLAARCAIVATFGLLFAAGAYYGADRLVTAQNVKHLQDINETVLRYSETAIESADHLLAEIARDTRPLCDDVSMQAIRLKVYQHSAIKDLRVATADGAVRCSAYEDTLEFDRSWPSRAEMLPVDGRDLRVFRVEQFTSDAIGVFRDTGPTSALIAIVGVDPRQLDVMPGALREYGSVSLALADDRVVATHAGADWATQDADTVLSVLSKHYPIRTTIRVDREALAGWNAAPAAPVLAAAGALGGLFGFLLARLLARPRHAASALDAAISAREFRPYYQPIFSLEKRSVLGCEVLMRWAHQDGRIVPPSAFIPLAESTGRIEAMTWQILDEALRDLRVTMRSDPAFKVSVNVVPRQFLSQGFAAHLKRVVIAAGASPSQVVLEITERDELDDFDRAQTVITELRASGFRVAVDDVGVGHSGLSYIQRLRPDTLKIDKFFVDSLALDGSDNTVVSMLVRLARELGMGIVAEGVETDVQAAALQTCGVDEAQGYLFAAPLPAKAFLTLLGVTLAGAGAVTA